MVVIGFSILSVLTFSTPSAEAQTAPPTKVVLDFASDSGTSSTDNVTSDNTPEIGVFGTTVSGATVTVTATKGEDTLILSLTRTHPSTYFTFNTPLEDGVWTFSATQRLNGVESVPTAPLTVTIDTVAPIVAVMSPAQTEEATSRTFSAADGESGVTTMKVAVQTESTCAASAPESAESYNEGSDYVVTGPDNNNKYLCFWSEDVAGNVERARSDRIQNLTGIQGLAEISAIPGTPDLATASDSGVDNDNITNDSTPTFTVNGTVSGATVTVTATKGSDITIGTVTASGVSTDVTFTTPLSDGIWSVSAAQTETGGKNESPSSAPLTVTIDTASPDNLVVNSATGGKKRVTIIVTVDRGNPNIPDEIHLAFGGDCASFGENGVSSSVSVPVGTQTGQSHTFTVSAPKGLYDNCTIRVVDRAGNGTSDVTIPSFRVRGSSGTVGGIRATSAPHLPGSPSHDTLPSDSTVLSQVETITGSTLFSRGQRDERIRAMQVALNDTSCKVSATGAGSPGNESTYFGERTRNALACYQQQEGLPVTGNYDTATHLSLRQNLIRNRLIALFERYDRNIVDFFDEHDLDISTFGLRQSDVQ